MTFKSTAPWDLHLHRFQVGPRPGVPFHGRRAESVGALGRIPRSNVTVPPLLGDLPRLPRNAFAKPTASVLSALGYLTRITRLTRTFHREKTATQDA
jgi:hypothetical protein